MKLDLSSSRRILIQQSLRFVQRTRFLVVHMWFNSVEELGAERAVAMFNHNRSTLVNLKVCFDILISHEYVKKPIDFQGKMELDFLRGKAVNDSGEKVCPGAGLVFHTPAIKPGGGV